MNKSILSATILTIALITLACLSGCDDARRSTGPDNPTGYAVSAIEDLAIEDRMYGAPYIGWTAPSAAVANLEHAVTYYEMRCSTVPTGVGNASEYVAEYIHTMVPGEPGRSERVYLWWTVPGKSYYVSVRGVYVDEYRGTIARGRWSNVIDTESPLDERPSEYDEIQDYLPEPDEFVPLETYPEMIHQCSPEYPVSARQAGKEGTVWVQALVSKTGLVLDARVAKSSGVSSLDEAAVGAAFCNLFKPGYQNGQPVACWVTYKVDFRLT